MNPLISIYKHLYGSQSELNIHTGVPLLFIQKKENLLQTNHWRKRVGKNASMHRSREFYSAVGSIS
jgi:hypothetical protein